MDQDAAHLLVTASLASGARRFRLGPGEHVLGSASDADLQIDDPTVSRRHLRLVFDGDCASVADLGSSNGTWINGQRVVEAELDEPALELRVGEISIRIERLDPGEARLAVPGDGPHGGELLKQPPRTTWAEGVLARFSLRDLPALIDALAAGLPTEAFAHRLATALAAAVPAAGFTLLRETAVIASAGQAAGAATRVGRGPWAVEVFAGEDIVGRNEPLCRLALGLLRAAEVRAPQTSPTAAQSSPPPQLAPPDPPTLSPALQSVYEQAARLAPSEIGVLILGETGTGKELLARFIHARAGLPIERLVELNCAALPVDLLEAELFGIEKGVATGVVERAGRFEQADGGTLFLDEIGDMALETQAKILRVLQEKQVYRVGSSRPRPARVRVISATHRDLEAMVGDGGFRRDLYHRLADWTAELPPLRHRPEDIANLAAHFLAGEMRRQGKRFGGLSESAVSVLARYAWPGNVRELEREMLRCSLFLESGEPLQSSQLQPRFHRPADNAAEVTLKAQLERAEAAAIREALVLTRGDVEAAANRLGCGKSTLYRRISQLGIDTHETDTGA